MVAQTRLFGEITIEDDKVLDFPNGIIGIEDKHKFAIIYDADRGSDTAIRWLQSMEDPYLALPVLYWSHLQFWMNTIRLLRMHCWNQSDIRQMKTSLCC